MPAYRLYKMDGSGGFAAAEWIEAADDEAAVAMVRKRKARGAFELWRGNRMVGRIDPRD